MKIIGIIMEANPLHHGHEYLINKVKNKHNPDCLVAVVSTYFSMRGDINCVTKKDKIDHLLNSGFDLVFELPIGLSLHRSDIFAKNAVNILKQIGITHLAFGSEVSDIEIFNKIMEYTLTNEFNEYFKIYLNQNLSYKNASIKALSNFINPVLLDNVINPNFTLGLEYLKNIKDTNIEPIVIKRIGSYNEKTPTSAITSATAVRYLIYKKQPINDYVSFDNYLDLNKMYTNIMLLIKNKLFIEEKTLSNDLEGLGNYIKNNGDFNLEYPEFIDKLANKKYTKTRIRRYIINLLLENELDNTLTDNYLRLIGFNHIGIKYINTLPQEIKEQIFSTEKNLKNKNIQKYLDLELKSNKLFSLLAEKNTMDEYILPVRKD